MRRRSLLLLLGLLLAPATGAWAQVAATPTATLDAPIFWEEIDLPPPGKALAVVSEAARDLKQRERERASELGWSLFKEHLGRAGLSVSAYNLVREGPVSKVLGEALGDLGLILSLAQVNLDLQKDRLPPGSGLGLLRDVALWAAGRFGWRALSVSASVLGIASYFLDQVGAASVTARQTPARVAFEVYFGGVGLGTAEGHLSDEELFARLWAAKVGSVEDAERVLRAHFATFWKKGPEAVQQYTIPERVQHEVGWLGRLLYVGVGKKPKLISLNREDERAIEDDYLRDVYLERLRTYFEEALPQLVRRQAKGQAARRLNALRERMNQQCTLKLRVVNPPADLQSLVPRLGPWRWPAETSLERSLEVSRHAYSSLPEGTRDQLRLDFRTASGGGGSRFAKLDSLLSSLGRRRCPPQTLTFDLGGAPTPPPAPEPEVGNPLLARLRAAVKGLGLPWGEPDPIADGERGDLRHQGRAPVGGRFGGGSLKIEAAWNGARYDLLAPDESQAVGLEIRLYRDPEERAEEWREWTSLEGGSVIDGRKTTLEGRPAVDLTLLMVAENGPDPLLAVVHQLVALDGERIVRARLEKFVRTSSLAAGLSAESEQEGQQKAIAAARSRAPRAPVAEARALLRP